MKPISFFLCICILLVCIGCSVQAPSAQIAATTLPVYEFTARLCQGTGITVTRLVTESVSCLHDYSLQVRQVKAAEAAQLLVISGGGLEAFLDGIVQSKATVDAGAQIEACHGHDHEGHHHETDPHYWLSPENAKRMAANICNGLCERFPAHASQFSDNLAQLHSDLDALLQYGKAQLSDLKSRKLITFHDGFSYFAHSFDLEILEAIEEESGSEASAQELKELILLVQQHQLPAIFTERSGSASAAQVISRETGVAVYSLDMAMAGDSYFDAMYHNIDTVKEALG